MNTIIKTVSDIRFESGGLFRVFAVLGHDDWLIDWSVDLLTLLALFACESPVRIDNG